MFLHLHPQLHLRPASYVLGGRIYCPSLLRLAPTIPTHASSNSNALGDIDSADFVDNRSCQTETVDFSVILVDPPRQQ